MKMSLRPLPAALFAAGVAFAASLTAATVTTNGEIREPGERDTFTFRLEAERVLVFDSLTPESQLRWSLAGPRGAVVENRSLANSDAQRLAAGSTLLPLVPGDYVLAVEGNGAATSPYSFRLADLADATVLTLGANVTNRLVPAQATAFYQFPASAGDQVRFDLLGRTNFDGRIRLFGPTGSVVHDGAATDSPVLSLSPAGTYTLLLEGDVYSTGESTVIFNLENLGNVPPPVLTGTAIALGQTVSGTTAAGTTNFFTVQLAVPTWVAMDALDPASGVNWSLTGPDGLVVNRRSWAGTDGISGDPLLRLSPGTHQLQVTGTANRDFAFRLLDVGAATPLVTGAPTTNVFATSRETVAYRFNAPAGSRWFYQFLDGDVSGNTYLRWVDPFGGVAYQSSARAQYGPVTLNLAGTWTLLVESYVHESPIERTLEFALLPVSDGLQSLTLGAVVDGAITAPGQTQRHTFTLPTRAGLYLDALVPASSLGWSLTGPEGTVVGRQSFQADEGTLADNLRDLPPGDYTLDVSGDNGRTNSYQFRLSSLATATPLVPEVPMTDELNPGTEARLYRFTAAAGTRMFFDALTGNTRNALWQLRDRFDRQLFYAGLSQDQFLTLEAGGEYRLWVQGYVHENAPVPYSFVARTVADTSEAITVGSTVTRTLAMPGQTRRFTFSLASPKRLYFDVLSSGGSTRWRLDGSDGQVSDWKSFAGTDSHNGLSMFDLPAGSYTVAVNATGDDVPEFSYRLLDLDTAPALALEEAVSGELTPWNGTEVRRISVPAGAKLYFDATGGSARNAAWRLLDPSGRPLFFVGLRQDQQLTVGEAGTYTLLLEGYYAENAAPTYEFVVRSVNDGNSSLALGATIGGSVATPGQTQTYEFTLAAERRLYFDALSPASGLYWSLSGPRGAVVNRRAFAGSDGPNGLSLLTLPAGSYRLTVDADGDTTGAYSFRLLDLAEASPLNFATELTSRLEPFAKSDLFRFEATAGDRLLFDTSTSPARNAYWRLVGPNSDIIFVRYLGSDSEVVTLAYTGTYTLMIEGYVWEGDAVDYRFQVLPQGNVPNLPYAGAPLALDAFVTGSLATATDVTNYVFTVNTPITVHFDAQPESDHRVTLQRRDDGSGNELIINNRRFDSWDYPFSGDTLLRLLPGEYQLSVTGVAGDFRFRLVNADAAPLLAVNTDIAGTSTPASASRLYRLSGNAGDEFFIQGGPVSGFQSTPYGTLWLPWAERTSIADMPMTSYRDTFRLPYTGTYYWLVSTSGDDTGNEGAFAFRFHAVANPTNTIVVGEVVNGQIGIPGQTRHYRFSLPAEATLQFDALSYDDTVRFDLVGPEGLMFQNRAFWASDYYLAPQSRPLHLPAGDYQLSFSASRELQPTFAFRLIDLATAPSLTPGTAFEGSATPGVATAAAAFNGNAGERYFLRTTRGAGWQRSPVVTLHAPSGDVVLNVGLGGQVDTFTLAESGRHVFTVISVADEPAESGAFTLELLPVTDTAARLALGETKSGDISSPGQTYRYSFSLAEAKRLHFDILAGDGSFTMRLFGPAGERSLQFIDFYSGTPWFDAVAGEYELHLRRNGDGVGPFRFRLLDFAAASPLAPDSETTVTLDPGTATVLRRFEGAAGQRFYFDGRGYTGGTRAPLAQLVSPGGTTLFRTYLTGDADTFTLPQSGTYTLLLLGEPGETAPTNALSFRLVPNLPQPEVPIFEDNTAPDLVVTDVTANPATGVTTGSSVLVQWTVRNNGSAPVSRSFTDRVTLRNRATGLLLDTRLAFDDLAVNGPLSAGASRSRSVTVHVPDGPAAAGLADLSVTTDTLNNVAEGNDLGTAEANNTTVAPAVSVELSPYPDLRVLGLAATPAGECAPGSTVALSWLTTNATPVTAAAPWAERVTVRNLTTGRVLANFTTNVLDGLASPDTLARAATFELPNNADAYGQIEISVVTDAEEQVFEHLAALDAEANNAASLPVLNEAPALSLSLAATRLTEGQTVQITLGRRPAGVNPLIVQLTSSADDQFTVPGTLVIPANAASVTFESTAVDDAFVERTNTYVLTARSAGFRDASATVTVEDNDRPSVALTLAAGIVSEGAGPNATSATVTRSPVSPRALTIGLNSGDTAAARVPASVTIPANQASVSFPVAAVDNATVDGTRNVALGGFVLDAFTSQALYEIAPALLAVTDNDGATLTLRIAADLVGEGRTPATTATVSRNTATAEALVVSLSSSDLTEATVPPTVTIPAGELSAQFPVTSLNDGETDGNRTVTITASAAGFTAGSDTVVVSDADLADLIIGSITFPATGVTDGNLAITFRLENRGLRDAAAPMTQRVFLSTDNLAGSDTLVAQAVFDGPLPVGQTISQTVNIRLPEAPGTFYVVVQADATNAQAEALENNNTLVSATAFTTSPAYAATVSTDVTTALAGTPVALRGFATRGDGGRAPNEHVTVHVRVRGTERQLEVVTDANGDFATTFRPLPNEAGRFQIAAAYPGLPMPAVQDEFSLLGLDLVSPGFVTVTEGSTFNGTTRIRNLCDVPLTGLVLEVTDFDPSLNVVAGLETNRLAGDGEIVVNYAITPVNRSIVQSGVRFRVTTAEGAVDAQVFTVRQEFLRPALVTTPGRLSSSMLRGRQTLVNFEVANNGGLATGPIDVLMPNLPWLSVSTPARMEPLAPGARTTVSLLLTPSADLALGDYPGNLVLSGGNTALTVPFEFRAISDNRGSLVLTAEDEYTYFAAGGPKVTNALVVLTDALSGVNVSTNVTGADGTARFSDITEAQYIVSVQADRHGPFRQTAFVPAGGATNVVAFLPRETVRYSFTVTPTAVEDRYAFTVESTFETQVPIPVVTIEPATLDIAGRPEDEFQVNYTIRNHGLIAANNVALPTKTGGNIEWIPLINEIGRLEANASITVPVTIRRVRAGANGQIVRNDFRDGRCSVTAGMIWDYLCGPSVVNRETATYTFDSTGCDLVDLYRQVFDVVPDPAFGPPVPNDHPCQNPATFYACLDQFQPVIGFTPPPGFKFECKSTRPPVSVGPAPAGIRAARAGLPSRAADAANEVCAKVKLRLDQKAVLTRDAFNALLEIDNDTTSPIENILVTLNITAEDGSTATTQFGIREPVLGGLSAVNGTGIIQPKTIGSASWILIPSLEAAPTNGVALFLVGGTLSYSQDGADLTIPLAPAPIQVYPQPELLVRYFHQRDVFSDDPFTPEVEPSLPYSLAVQIVNEGYGAAKNLKLQSGQPQIVENEKGLLIAFKTVGTQLENQELTPSLDVDFGEIGVGTNRIARWLFTSSLQGSFTDYKASFEHLDALGTKRLSLVKGVEIHELVRIVNADGAFDDARPDFLVSATNDPDHLPRVIYLSDGRTNAVASHTNAGVSGVLSATNKRVTLTAALGSGWSYLRVPDPAGAEAFTLRHVLRADGSEIAFGTNAWTTDRIFRGGDKRPIVTNLVHILDHNSTGTYTLVYDDEVVLPPDTTAPTSAVAALPAASGNTISLTWSGWDDRGPVAGFDVYVATDDGAYVRLLERTALTGTVFTGESGRRYRFYSVATDAAGNAEATPASADAETLVSVVNGAPTLAYGDVTLDEGNAANASATAVDPDGDALAFALVSGPAGVIVNPTTGFVTWPTSEKDGPSTNTVRIRVTDNGTPALSATNEFRIIVRELNSSPELGAPADMVISENNLFTAQLTGSDTDLPPQSLTYGLAAGAPQGVAVDPASGHFTWRPRGNQGPSTNQITVTVTDSGSPARSVQRTFTLYVRDTAAELAVTAGRTNLLAGEGATVPLTLAAGPDLDSLEFVLSGDVARLGELSLANLAPDVTGVQLIPRPNGDSEMRITLTGGALSASRPLADVAFSTPANAPSGSVPLAFSELTGTAGERYITRTASSPGRIIVVNEDAVLEFTGDPATPLHLYGRPGLTYRLEHSPVLGAGAVWTPVRTLTADERVELVPADASGGGGYYRAFRE